MKKIFSKKQFNVFAHDYSSEVQRLVNEEFVDGYKFGFDASANRAYQSITCIYRESIEGKHCIFFYYGKERNFHSFICGDTIQEAI